MKVEVESPLFHLRIKPGLTAEERAEVAHAICRFLIDPPRPVEELRRVAVRAALNQYEGSPSGRAKQLAGRYQTYIASSGWRLERDLESLPDGRSTKRKLLHRIARLNGGKPLHYRRLFDIAAGSPQG
jgi:hypothetical protein